MEYCVRDSGREGEQRALTNQSEIIGEVVEMCENVTLIQLYTFDCFCKMV